MPGGTIDVATSSGEVVPSAEMRRQSTAEPNAWRTRTSSNGGRVVSKP
jgi:hypothetical protein